MAERRHADVDAKNTALQAGGLGWKHQKQQHRYTEANPRTCKQGFLAADRQRSEVELLLTTDTAAHVKPSTEEIQTCEQNDRSHKNDTCMLKGCLMQVN